MTSFAADRTELQLLRLFHDQVPAVETIDAAVRHEVTCPEPDLARFILERSGQQMAGSTAVDTDDRFGHVGLVRCSWFFVVVQCCVLICVLTIVVTVVPVRRLELRGRRWKSGRAWCSK